MDEGASDSHRTRTCTLIKWARDPGAHSMTTGTRAEAAPACTRATGGHAAQLCMRACMAAAHVSRGPSEPLRATQSHQRANLWQSAAAHVSHTVPDPFHSLRASYLASSSSATLSSSSRGPWKASALAIASKRRSSANFSDLSTFSATRGKGAANAVGGGWKHAWKQGT